MTDRSIIMLEDDDGAIVFRADGSQELKIPNLNAEEDCPEHIVVMTGIFDRCADPLFRAEMVRHMETEALQGRGRR